MNKHQIATLLSIALAGSVSAGEPMVGHAVAASTQLPYACDASKSAEPTLLQPEMGCFLMRRALEDSSLSEADKATAFLSGAQLRQQELMMVELRAIRAQLAKLEGGAK